MQYLSLPNDMITVLAGETTDFTIAGRHGGSGGGGFLLLFGGVWTSIVGLMVFMFFSSLFTQGEVHFTLNEHPVVASMSTPQALLVPAVFFSIFLLIGIGMLVAGAWSMVNKPGYFAGTPTRLVHYQRGRISTYNWSEFNGNLQINRRKGTIMIELKTGYQGKNSYIPKQLHIKTKADVLELERLVRQRIQAVRG